MAHDKTRASGKGVISVHSPELGLNRNSFIIINKGIMGGLKRAFKTGRRMDATNARSTGEGIISDRPLEPGLKTLKTDKAHL